MDFSVVQITDELEMIQLILILNPVVKEEKTRFLKGAGIRTQHLRMCGTPALPAELHT